MNNEVISDRAGISLIILFISGGALALPTAQEAGRDLWLAIFVGVFISIPIVLMYARILALFPGKDLFDIVEMLLGEVFGKIIILLFSWFAFHLGALTIRNVGEFMITTSLPETPLIIPMIFIGLLCIWGAKEGIEVLGRWSNLFFVFNAPLPTLLILLLIPQMDLNNIFPILNTDIKSFALGTFSAIAFPLTETIVFAMAIFSLKSPKSSYNIYIKGLIIGGILIAGVSLAEILVLGEEIYSITYFPNHNTARKLNVGDFLERLEVVVIIATYTASFIKISVCLLASSKGISRIFGFKDYRFITLPVGLFMCMFSYILHDSIMDLYKWAAEFWKFYAFPFEIIIPTGILVIAEIRKNKLKGYRKVKNSE